MTRVQGRGLDHRRVVAHPEDDPGPPGMRCAGDARGRPRRPRRPWIRDSARGEGTTKGPPPLSCGSVTLNLVTRWGPYAPLQASSTRRHAHRGATRSPLGKTLVQGLRSHHEQRRGPGTDFSRRGRPAQGRPRGARHPARRNWSCYRDRDAVWPANRRALWIRALGCLFVFAILADVCFDVDCDGALAPPAHGATVAASSGDGSPDACARGCVPDCYCCSQSITTGPAVLPPDAGPVVPMQAPLSTPSPVGVRPVPYRPPLLLT